MLKTAIGNIRYIQNAWRESRLYTSWMILLNILVNAMPVWKVLAVGRLIDDVMLFQKRSMQSVLWDVCQIFSVYLLEYGLGAVQSYLNYKFTIRLNNGMEDRFYSKLSRIQYAVLENNESNDLIFQVKDGIGKKFAEGFSKILELAGLLVRIGSMFLIVLTKNIGTGLVLLAVFICLAPLYRKIGEDNYAAYAESNQEFRRARNYRQILSDREYANEREAFGYCAFFNEKWKVRYQNAIEKERKASKRNHLKILAVTAAVAALTTLLSGILIPAMRNGSLSLGVYIVIVTQLYNLVHFMSWNFSYIIDDLSENQLYLDDFDAFMKLDTVLDAENGKTVSKDKIHIQVKSLSFRYPGCDNYVLKDFSFEFQEGKHYAVIGKNGAGKTTLVKLLLGLYEEYEGEILINGTDIRALSRDEIRTIFSAVFQDYAKYALTVKENILLERADHADKERQAEEILDRLGILEEIRQLKDGMHTPLGKIDGDGVDLSGGQWQKIAIARGAVSDARVFILDEPSSSLDPISERRLYEIYNQIFREHTTILITHRLGNTKEQDEILVLDEGRLVEHGSHQELMEHRSAYFTMFVRQRSWYHETKM